MRTLFLALTLPLLGCHQPTESEEAMAEIATAMRSQTRMVRADEGLAEIFDCTEDCSGHRAGYLWAIDNPDVTSEEWCDNPSASFQDGCLKGLRAAAFE